ncbi:MAG: twin arginine-targeting protein translocase TatB [Epsilonproteobacteria bacterium 4484_65]|nr:MAG: twin arginine-targeting protein translocase TatB [Epsilonproteobacteria bacterium 4484_65]
MFGIGFTELLLISVIAILFLGPDKLPDTMVQIAKFIKSVKNTIGEAKSSLEEEMKIADLKDEALKYKSQLDNATNELKSFKNIDFDDMDDLSYDDEVSTEEPKAKKESPYAERKAIETPVETKSDTVTFKKEKKIAKNKKSNDNKGDA